MSRATLRFYEELNDFLPPAQRKRDLDTPFDPPCPVRHLIELFGVPHTEVEIILLNGRSVGLNEPVPDGARISVYPLFESLDVTSLLRLRARPLRRIRFIADAHLGKLARHLRLLGFDTLFGNDPGDAELVRMSSQDGRILLTRDRRLLMRREVTHGCYVRDSDPFKQLVQVLKRCDLYGDLQPFTRCMECNGRLQAVKKSVVEGRLPDRTRRCFDEFWECDGCGRIYWKGSHYERLTQWVKQAADSG